MLWNGRQRRTMVNGRLVAGASNEASHFSWLKAAVVIAAVTFLYISNPASDLKVLRKYVRGYSNVFYFVPKSWWNDIIRSIDLHWSYTASQSRIKYWSLDWRGVNARRTTNFGLFCTTEQQDIQVIVYVAGFRLPCPYDDPSLVLGGHSFCRDVLRNHMTHLRPIFFDENDYVYTTHRIISWLLVGTALLSFCYTSPIMITTGYSMLDSLTCFFFDTNREATQSRGPVSSLGMKLLYLNVFIYPVLLAMDETVQLQRENSLFASFESDEANFALSLSVLVGIAVLMSIASKSWSLSPFYILRQFDAVTAVAMGYYTAYRVATTPNNSDSYSWNVLTLTCFFLFISNGSFMGIVFWCVAHCFGYFLFLYQFSHVSTIRTITNWLDSASSLVEQFAAYIFRPPQHRPVNY